MGPDQADPDDPARASRESISVLLFAYIGCVFFAMLYYGYVIRSIAAIANGLLGCWHVAVRAQLRRFPQIVKTRAVSAVTV